MPEPHQNHPPDATPLDLMLDADREIAAAETGDSYHLYECLRRAADRLACAEAFYICLYSEDDQSLLFPYNYDNGVYDFPSTYPLGTGPTSCVIRRKTPFIWNTVQESCELRGIRFGDLDTPTHSAVHLPMPKPGASPDDPLLGVLSAQSYHAHAFGPEQIRLLQWLADRAGAALDRVQTRSDADEQQQQSAWIADQCVQIVNRLSHEAQALRTLVPPEQPQLRDAAANLLRACYRAQTEVNQLPLRAKSLPPPPLPAPTDPLAGLTDRERDILRLLSGGCTNSEIAQQLFIATNTVKDHLKRVFAKIGVSSRHEAAQWFRTASE